jgi:hypothetical protein
MTELRTDHQVMDRYMRHFRMTSAEVIAYMSGLHSARLTHDYPCTQYSVPQDGVLKSHQSVVKAGELVLMDAAGVPVIRIKCGNPLAGPVTPKAPLEANVESSPAGLQDLVADATTVPANYLALSVPPVPTLPELDVPATPPVTPVAPLTAPSSGHGDLAFLALGALFHGGGGGGSPKTTPVPEPTTIGTMVVGIAALVRKRKRNR